MTAIQLRELIEKSTADKFRFAITDIDGILRGKIISKAKLLKALDNKIGFCNVIFGWDCNDVCYDNGSVSGWHTGYPDAFASIDANTYRTIPWNDHIPFVLGDFSEDEQVKNACPRTLLKQVIQQCEQMGFKAKFAKEFEWFNFNETAETLYQKQFANLTPLSRGMFGYSILRPSEHQEFYNHLFNWLKEFNIPLEGLHTETGDGVYEAAIEYTDTLEAADRAVLFKTAVKEIAYKHNLTATFMAKWNMHLPGCSGHIHQHLFDDNNQNLFYDAADEHNMSELMQQYTAGQLYCLPYILPMFAPTTNSYKRYVTGAWSATTVSWGIENRTTALRVVNKHAASVRLETRVPGSDANPYLSIAASLAAGLYGIKNKLSLKDYPAVKGSAYDDKHLQILPKTLADATAKMKASTIAKALFGEQFTDHFIRTREWECRQVDETIPNAELKRYFEII